MPPPNLKKLTKDNLLKLCHWDELGHLYNHFKTFYKAIIMVEGNYIGLTDYFQTLDWLLLELEKTKQKFLELLIEKWKLAQAKNY